MINHVTHEQNQIYRCASETAMDRVVRISGVFDTIAVRLP